MVVNRYSSQIILPEIGTQGQELLSQKRVLCIGAGGLAASVLPYLAAAGVGKITLLDDDVVAISNLNRQVLFTEQDIGIAKAEVVAAHLKKQNPHIVIEFSIARFNLENGFLLVDDCDLVVDCSDDYATKLAINYWCGQTNTPWVYGSVLGWDGQVALFTMEDALSPCYKCFQHKTPNNLTSCSLSGVLGPAVSVVGSYQALLTLQALLGNYHNANTLKVFDLWTLETRSLLISRHLQCKYHNNSLNEITGISYQEIKGKLPQAKLIDVRSSEEWENGHYPEAIHLPIGVLLSSVEQYFSWDDELILYCNRQTLSNLAANNLRELGYSRVYILTDGYKPVKFS